MKRSAIVKLIGFAMLVASLIHVFHRQDAVIPVSAEASSAASAVPGVEDQPQAEAGKASGIAMPPESERPPYPPVEENITAQTNGVAEVRVGTSAYLVYGTGVYSYRERDDKWGKVSEFPIPDEALFKKYRPKATIWTYETEIGLSTVAPGKIWAGYKFYNGEGFNGIGGAVFYNVATGETGVLRHPALLDCSAGTLSVSDERLVVRTSWQGEGGSSVCNGVVAIDLKTLKAVSYMPVGSTTITDNDPAPGDKLLGDKYNAPLDKVLSEEAGFEKKDAPNWSDAEREKILAEGLDRYMIRTAREEAAAGAAAKAARPKDVRSEHMWIGKGRNP